MSYTALYRAWRPVRFSDLAGQEHVSKTLRKGVEKDLLSHSYLFCGPRGTGKTSTAKILARAVNCLNPVGGEPCNECENCRQISSDSFLDVFEIDAASNRGIDEIREIREKVRFAPSQGKRKVYIIDEVHMLTKEAFNALLKTLEEPPSHVLFILATTEPHKIPLTILSRCQRFDFHNMNEKEIFNYLKEKTEENGIGVTEDALRAVAYRAMGGMRDALSILDQCIAFAEDTIAVGDVEAVLGTAGRENVEALVRAVLGGDTVRALSLLDGIAESGKDMGLVVGDLAREVRETVYRKISGREKDEFYRKVPLGGMEFFLKELVHGERDMRFSGMPRLVLETVLIEAALNSGPAAAEKTEHPPAGNPIRKKQDPGEPVAYPERAEENPEEKTLRPEKKPEPEVPVADCERTEAPAETDSLKREWPRIVNLVKKEKISTSAFLKAASPISFDGKDFVIGFESVYTFHKENTEKPENRTIVEKALREIYGGSPVLICRLDENGGGEKMNLSESFNRAVDIFGGKPIDENRMEKAVKNN